MFSHCYWLWTIGNVFIVLVLHLDPFGRTALTIRRESPRSSTERMAARAIMRHCQIRVSCGDLFTVVELILIAGAVIGRRLQNYRRKSSSHKRRGPISHQTAADLSAPQLGGSFSPNGFHSNTEMTNQFVIIYNVRPIDCHLSLCGSVAF